MAVQANGMTSPQTPGFATQALCVYVDDAQAHSNAHEPRARQPRTLTGTTVSVRASTTCKTSKDIRGCSANA